MDSDTFFDMTWSYVPTHDGSWFFHLNNMTFEPKIGGIAMSPMENHHQGGHHADHGDKDNRSNDNPDQGNRDRRYNDPDQGNRVQRYNSHDQHYSQGYEENQGYSRHQGKRRW
ncbi:hypothetical protein WDU94_011871 [Cyamophila willieti]